MKKNAKFQALGAPPSQPRASGGWRLCPQTHNSLRRLGAPKQPPNCEFLATRLPQFALFKIILGVLACVLNSFFLIVQFANLMVLTIDVCLMLNCFLFEKFYLHYALCDFDSILCHCTKLFIRQSIDREQIFDVTFQNPLLKSSAYATNVRCIF